MKLYQIKVRHCGPKSQIEAIITYVITDNEEKIYNYIDKNLLSGIWTDKTNDDLQDSNYLEDDGFIPKDTFKDEMLKYRGEFNYPKASYDDLYYGVKHYGWSKGLEISEDEIKQLIKLNIAIMLD